MKKFSWKRTGKVTAAAAAVLFLAAAGYAAVTSRTAKILWADLARDSRENFLSCEDLPFYPQVQKVLSLHQDEVLRIEKISGSKVSAREIKCRIIEGGAEYFKGDVEIAYPSRASRRQIAKLIGDNFFGIPWRGVESEK